MAALLPQTELICLTAPATSSTATSSSVVLDMANCDGAYIIVSVGDAAAAWAASLVVGSTSDASGSTVSTKSSTDNDKAVVFDHYKPVARYARVLVNPGAGAIDGRAVYALKYGVREVPVSQGTTTVSDSTLIVGSTA